MEFEIVDQDSGKSHSSIVKVAFCFRSTVILFPVLGSPGDHVLSMSLVQTRPNLWHEREY